MAIEPFKLEDGREGLKTTMPSGLIKLLFDDGDMVILAPNDRVTKDSRPPDPREVYPRPPEPTYPRIVLAELPKVVQALCQGTGDPRYAVLMFVPQGSEDGEYVNLQYSLEEGVLGLDWVLLGGRNRRDRAAVKAHAAALGHPFARRRENDVSFLRVEGEGLVALGQSLLSTLYHLDQSDQVELLAEGFAWPPTVPLPA